MSLVEDAGETRILLVEDTESWQRIVRRALADTEYRVECVAEGEVALAMIEDDPPDLLLLDIYLPGTSGFEILEELRSQERHANLPVLIMTSERKIDGLLRSFELGADDFLYKPFQAPELKARIASKLRVRRLQEQVRVAAEATAREIELARRLQRRFLPLPPPSRPDIDIVACYRPSSSLGGDYFDVLDLGGSRTGLFIADVVGHGAPAALITSFLKALSVHGHGALTGMTSAPCTWMAETSHDLLATFPGMGLFVTAIFVVVDPANQQLVHVNAGHCEPILLRRGRDPVSLSGGNLPLGISEDPRYESFETDFLPGDRLFLFTDGILEQRHHSTGELFGRDRLLEIVSETSDSDLPNVAHRAEECLLDWADGELHDDFNLLACELRKGSERENPVPLATMPATS